MSVRKLSNEQPEQMKTDHADREPVLKGTFASVMLLGVFLAILILIAYTVPLI